MDTTIGWYEMSNVYGTDVGLQYEVYSDGSIQLSYKSLDEGVKMAFDGTELAQMYWNGGSKVHKSFVEELERLMQDE